MPKQTLPLVAVLLITAVGVEPAARQVRPTGSSESQKGAVTAVLVDVVVRDRNGEPVRDLRPEEFQIVEDGVRQSLGSFTPIFRDAAGAPATGPLKGSAVAGASAVAAPAAPANDATAAAVAAATGPTEVLALVFDRLSPDARALAHRAALQYLGQQDGTDRIVGVFGIDLSLISYQGFTADAASVRRAIDDFGRRATSQFGSTLAERQALAERQSGAETALGELAAMGAGGQGSAGAGAGAGGAATDAQFAAMQQRMLLTFETLERDQRGYATANSLMAIVSGMRTLPGRKTIVMFSEGLSIPPNVQDRYTAVIAAANRANVSIYAMDAAGLRTESTLKETRDDLMQASRTSLSRNPSRDVTGAPMTAALERNEDRLRFDPHSGLGQLTQQTGGLLVSNTNDFRRGFARVDSDMRNYYMLTYVPTNAEFDGNFREISVRVTRPDVTVQHRRGYFAVRAPAGAPVLSYEAPVFAALEKTPVPNAFPVRAAAMRFPEGGRPGLTSVVVELPTAGITFEPNKEGNNYRSDFTVLVRFTNQAGEVVEKMSQRYELQGPIDQMDRAKLGEVIFYREPVLPAGAYTMETAVYDALSKKASVRYGTVDVREIDTEALRMSALVLVRRGEKVPDTERIPGSPMYVGDTLIYPNLGHPVRAGADRELGFYFTVYPQTSGDKPKASLQLLRNARPVADVPLELVSPDDELKIQQVSRVPVDKLSPGTYELRVIVKQGSEQVTRSVPFRVVS